MPSYFFIKTNVLRRRGVWKFHSRPRFKLWAGFLSGKRWRRRRERRKLSADLYHLGHLPYQLLKTVYKLLSARRWWMEEQDEEGRNQFCAEHRHQMLSATDWVKVFASESKNSMLNWARFAQMLDGMTNSLIFPRLPVFPFSFNEQMFAIPKKKLQDVKGLPTTTFRFTIGSRVASLCTRKAPPGARSDRSALFDGGVLLSMGNFGRMMYLFCRQYLHFDVRSISGDDGNLVGRKYEWQKKIHPGGVRR